MKEQLAHPGWCTNLVDAARLQPGERVLVLVDEPLAEEGSQLAAAVRDAGADPRLELWTGTRPLVSPPPSALEAAKRADASLFLAERPLGEEGGARMQLLEAVAGHGGRQIFLSFVDGELLRGELSQPPPRLEASARALLGALEDVRKMSAAEPAPT